ncbi:peptide ABC transporter substrate-binding protein [Salinivibrio costicola]|uniref:Peptide ABC transporter substrate-binding protein n=1 Tax=Salinivibrio costicola TaxID=51367 RepID=A0ABX6K8B6_SALCS|nr:peptide ABC transporter substrate-binding protein [Salinivibrio costicola]QIR07768.1 peptide ABC transporter substrate-binding protein [Salinivibrio costicola]
MKLKLLAGSLALALCSSAFAAHVPEGVELAEQQTLIWGVSGEVPTLDPTKSSDTASNKIISDLFEGLMVREPDGNVIPGLAKAWDMSEDGLTYIFHLRDAKWSDGTPITADDVVFTFQRVVKPVTGAPYAWYLGTANIKNAKAITDGKETVDKLGVKAIDTHTVEFTLERRTPYFPNMLTHSSTYPVPKHAVEKYGDNWTRPENMVNSGAYNLTNWVINERIDLERNPMYWNDKETVINKTSYVASNNINAEYNRYRTGEIDITSSFPLEAYDQIKKERPDELLTMPSLGTYYYLFNTQKAPFNDVRVRKALSYAIDRNVITNIILGQGQVPAYSVTPPAINHFEPPKLAWAEMTQEERYQKAKALLAEAGYSKDNPLEFELVYNTMQSHKKLALAVTSMWKRHLPVKVNLANQEWKTFLQKLLQKDFDVARYAWVGDYNEASTFLSYFSSDGMNETSWGNSQYDEVLDKALSIVDPEKRKTYYQEAERIFAKEMPAIPLYFYTRSVIKSPKVGGYNTENPNDLRYTRNLYITKN